MYPGEYPQALVRTTNIMCPVIAGYATARLRRQDPLFGSGNVGVNEDAAKAQITLQNVGSTSFTLQFKQSTVTTPPGTDSDGAATGTRTDLGSATVVVPGGTKTVDLVPYQDYLEVYGTSGSGSLRMQISSKVRWDEMAFDKTDTLQAVSLWQAKPVPAAPSLT